MRNRPVSFLRPENSDPMVASTKAGHRIVDREYGIPWQPGWVLRRMQHGVPVEAAIRASSAVVPGEFLLAPDQECRLLMPGAPGAAENIRLFTDLAICLENSSDTEDARLKWVLIGAADSLTGFVNDTEPLRFAAGEAAGQRGSLYAMVHPGQAGSRRLYLICREGGENMRFAIVQTAGVEEAFAKAEKLLEHDPLYHLVNAVQAYRSYLPRWTGRLPARLRGVVFSQSEILRACLRKPRGRLRHVWIAEQATGTERFILNDILLHCSVLVHMNVRMAAQLVQAALDIQAPDGGLPAWYHPDRDERAAILHQPILLQSVVVTARRLERPAEFLRRIYPGVCAYLSWLNRTYSPPAYPACQWPSSSEALIAETFDSDVLLPDVSALCLAELGAFQWIRKQVGSRGKDLDFDLASMATRITGQLCTDFRSSDSGFRAFFVQDRREVRRATVSLLIPLLVADRLFPPPPRHWVRGLLFRRGLLTTGGLSAWEPWPGDEEPPPVDLRLQFHALRSLQASGFDHEARSLASAILQARSSASREAASSARAGSQSPQAGYSAATDPLAGFAAAGASLLLYASAATTSAAENSIAPQTLAGRAPGAPVPKKAITIVSAFTAVTLLGLAGILSVRFSRRPPVSAIVPQLALAQYHYRFGDPKNAMPTYRQVFGYRPCAANAYLLGNVCFKAGDYREALYWYDTALRLDPLFQPARLNRALCLVRMGQAEAAFQDYGTAAQLALRQKNRAVFRRALLAAHLVSRMAGNFTNSGSSSFASQESVRSDTPGNALDSPAQQKTAE
ncbi:MAG TPA: tetratricopeptide repeat protein [Kiritimatiellae bacterium]|nr:tetratricopeptide repeat protein [Kiritimatiellia bacterium]